MGILLSYLFPTPKIIEPPPPDHKTYLRWQIPQFRTTWTNWHVANKAMISEKFSLVTRPSINLYLRLNTTEKDWSKNFYGISVDDFGGNQSIELSYKIWFENKNREKFNEQSASKDIYEEGFKTWGWQGLPKPELFKNIYNNNETLYICCEIVDLNRPNDIYKKFVLNNWQLYEDGIHDTVIYVSEERKEFKILKTFFMAQSPVFKTMFQSEFKEAKDNEVWIKEMDEKAMLGLIKWFYVAKVEDDDGSLENLFEAADKYQIDMLKSECIKCMISTLSDKNMLPRLAIAEFYNENLLKTQTLNYIETRPRLIVLQSSISQEWIDFSGEKTYAAAELSNLISEKLK